MKRIAFLVLMVVPASASADKALTKGATWDCKKDPVVAINHGGGKYTFKGECKTIAVNGGGVTLTVENSDEIDLNGGANKLTVDTVATINVNGAKNTVSWKKAKSGDKPDIQINGADNKVDQAK